MALSLAVPVPLLSLRVGRVAALGAEALPSAIIKHPVSGPLAVTRTGLAGDEQADRLHHGGIDKALHHYPAEHYPVWRDHLPQRAAAFEIGAFGENLSTLGLTEDTVCLGDIFCLGRAILQVSQGRSPCRKLNLRFDQPDMVEQVTASGRMGWYYRVLVEETVQADDALTLLERPHPDWPLDRLWRVLFTDPPDRPTLDHLAAMPVLSESWRQRARQRGRKSGPAAWFGLWHKESTK